LRSRSGLSDIVRRFAEVILKRCPVRHGVSPDALIVPLPAEILKRIDMVTGLVVSALEAEGGYAKVVQPARRQLVLDGAEEGVCFVESAAHQVILVQRKVCPRLS
jgi:hypothetical protein